MIKIIKKVGKKELLEHLYDLDIKDENLYKEINTNNYIGIFQFGGATCAQIVETVHPDNFDEMVAVNSLSRPGASSFTEQYTYNKYHPEHTTYPKAISDILQETYRVVLYQEQVMSVFNKIGGFTMEETNYVRGLMKKLGKADKKPEDLKKWEECVNRFMEGAIKNGITKAEANKVADDLLQLSAYSFNKSHAVAYTYTALMTLYLSYYFRKYFYSAVLTYEVDRKDYLFDRLQSVKSHGINVLPPDINNSKFHFSPFSDSIIFGLNDIKFVGEEPAKIIIKQRPYTSFTDFIIKAKDRTINKRVILALVSAGAFDSLEPNRKKLIYIAENYFERKASIKVEEKLANLIETITREAVGLNIQTTENDLINLEKEFFDFNFFYSVFPAPLRDKLEELKKKGLVETNIENVTSSIKVPVVIKKIKHYTDKNGKEMAFIDAEDMFYHSISTPIFQSLWKEVKGNFSEGKIHLINFYKNKKDDGTEQIMFGKDKWMENSEEIKRMVKPLLQS